MARAKTQRTPSSGIAHGAKRRAESLGTIKFADETERTGSPNSKIPRPMDGFSRIVEERILEAQKAGMFDNLPGRGKPLRLEDESWVPEDLRMAYHILKNARVLPPEAELLKEIRTLEDLMKYVEDEGERKAMAKSIQWKVIRLDLLKRRSLSMQSLRYYGKKLVERFFGLSKS